MAVALIALLVVVGLRYAAPGTAPVDENPPANTRQEDAQVPPEQSGQNNTPAETAPVSQEAEIEIEDFAYQPALITVKRGTTVTWTNKDAAAHTVTATSDSGGGPDSELLAEDESYSYTFNEVGEFAYFCEPHPYMEGVVQVVE